jgi:hypothetical protein
MDEDEFDADAPVIRPEGWSWQAFAGDLVGLLASTFVNTGVFLSRQQDQFTCMYLLECQERERKSRETEARELLAALDEL